MKASKILLLVLSCLFFSNKLFAQESSGEIIPCQEISIKCGQIRTTENIIRNEKEYQYLLNERSPHPDCGNYKLPVIDFNQYTLVGIVTGVGGCTPPKIEYYIIKNANNNYQFIFKAFKDGMCKKRFSVNVWCLIPKIGEDSKIEFRIDK